MDDMISRQTAIDAVENLVSSMSVCINVDEYNGMRDMKYRALKAIKECPSAQPERKTGKWINAYPDIEPNPMLMYGICSVCGFEQSISDKLKYCPNCGARMQEGEDK